mgnify:CR=1 FL=1|tara:strand:+ start:603 stop:1457 length:855 start_codon:yes stop_codon:yes gene_type:complete
MTAWDVSRIRDLLLEAGRIALDHFEAPRTELKDDNSLVTDADREIETYLAGQLVDGSDEAILIGEESAEGWTAKRVAAALEGTAWVVDPIDGTAPYANQLPTWGISLGQMHRGRLENGALFLPRTGELFITDGEQVLYHRGARNPAYWSFETLTPLPREDHPWRASGMVSLPQEIVHRGRFSGHNPVQSNGSAVYSVAKLIRGSYLCYIARIKLWDLAGSLPILDRLGFRVVFEDGRDLPLEVTPRDWVLDADSPRLWKSTGLLFIAHDPATLEHMRTHYHSGR